MISGLFFFLPFSPLVNIFPLFQSSSKSPAILPQSKATGRNVLIDTGNARQWRSLWSALTYLIQEEPRGLALAVRVARSFIDESPFFLMLGDNLIEGALRRNCSLTLASRSVGLLLTDTNWMPNSNESFPFAHFGSRTAAHSSFNNAPLPLYAQRNFSPHCFSFC